MYMSRPCEVCLVMSEYSLSGRGQGHASNFYIVDLENLATASRLYTDDIHNSTVERLFMTPIRQSDSVASWLSAHVYYTLPQCSINHVADVANAMGLGPQGASGSTGCAEKPDCFQT